MRVTLQDFNECLKQYQPVSKARLSNFDDSTEYKALTADGKIIITRHSHYGAKYIDNNTIRVLPKETLRLHVYNYTDVCRLRDEEKNKENDRIDVDVPKVTISKSLF